MMPEEKLVGLSVRILEAAERAAEARRREAEMLAELAGCGERIERSGPWDTRCGRSG